MKGIPEKFYNKQKSRLSGSSLVVFNTVITGQSITKRRLYKLFDKLVDKDDYSGIPKKEITFFAESLLFEGKFAVGKQPKRYGESFNETIGLNTRFK